MKKRTIKLPVKRTLSRHSFPARKRHSIFYVLAALTSMLTFIVFSVDTAIEQSWINVTQAQSCFLSQNMNELVTGNAFPTYAATYTLPSCLRGISTRVTITVFEGHPGDGCDEPSADWSDTCQGRESATFKFRPQGGSYQLVAEHIDQGLPYRVFTVTGTLTVPASASTIDFLAEYTGIPYGGYAWMPADGSLNLINVRVEPAVVTPTPTPTVIPTAVPTAIPTAAPTAASTPVSTAGPTALPTAVPPTAAPTIPPAPTPTSVPTPVPSPAYVFTDPRCLM